MGIRASAIYLQLNIGIITTSQKEEDAPILMHCGLPDKDTLWLGNITELHYQSIIKDDVEGQRTSSNILKQKESMVMKNYEEKELTSDQSEMGSNKAKNLDQCPV